MRLSTTLFGHAHQFRDVKDVLAKANEEKSGDTLAGIAAQSAQPDDDGRSLQQPGHPL